MSDSRAAPPEAKLGCAHAQTHLESDWLGASGSYHFAVCDACGEVVPGSGRFSHQEAVAPTPPVPTER
jgi:hypothetical protein